jgi:hypothetical protein
MSNKRFAVLLLVAVIGLVGAFAATNKSKPAVVRPGSEKPDKGRQHIAVGQSASYDTDVPTSGTHSVQPASWGVSLVELPNEAVVHNMEHGGVVVSYKATTDKETIDKLTALLSKPYSNKDFLPTKVILMPRSDQTAEIVLASWRRSQELSEYDEAKIIDYYNSNIGKSPEPTAS